MGCITMGYACGKVQNLDSVYNDGIDQITQEVCAGKDEKDKE